jgi:hypothetical protein
MVTIKHPRMRKTLARGTAKGERGLPQLTIRMPKKVETFSVSGGALSR